jgi:uncharacterized membrane protein YtjA (UPF0391 family)
MLKLTITFFVIALIAAFFGFTNIAVAAVGIARILFFVFLFLFVVAAMIHVLNGLYPRT